VRAELAARVRDAVAMLGYRQNLTASTLRRADGFSASVGLILEDVSNPFSAAVHRGAEDVARERGVLTFAASADERPEREREMAESFAARGVDGMIIAPAPGDHSYLQRDRAAGLALVFVDRPPGFIDADTVVSDNAGGARRAVEHLIAAGHRRIAFLGDRPQLATAAERLRGYREALAAQGLPVDPALIRMPADGEAHALLTGAEPPTALFTAQNLITVEAVRTLHELGRAHDVALVGFDDVPLSDVVDPPLTVIAQDPIALGRTAAELLFARLDGDRGPTRRVVLPTRLIARGSGELAARRP
jgi:LacI family transcriptional regulator